jgi:hypothetical protein
MQTKARKGAWIIGLGLALVSLFSLGVYVTYSAFTSQNPGANDFYSRWVGGCALLREGMNPYSENVTLRIQEGMYGRPALPGEDQVAFAYPLYSLIFFFPLCLIDNYALVQAIWFWLLLAVLAATTVLWMRVIRWRPQTWLWALTLLWVVLMYHSFRALILGQFAVFVLLTLVAALWALKHGHDGWAGVFLALSTIKPQMVYLAIPWILLWSAGQKRWRLWAGFGVAMASFVLGPVLLLPSWIHDFLRQVIAYPSYTVYGSLTWMIVQNWLKLGHAAELAVSAVLVLFLLVLTWRLRHAGWEQMMWMLGLILLMTNFFTPRIATTNYLLLVPWALWGFSRLQARLGWKGTWVVAIAEIASAVALWVLFVATVKGDFEQAPVYFPFPALLMLLLAWLWGQLRVAPDARSSRL